MRKTVVACYDLNGKLKRTYLTGKSAARSLKLHPRTIDKCIRGETKTAHNLIWKRCEPNNVPLLIEPLSTNTYIKNRAKKISQYSLDNKYIKTYKSINDAARQLHKPRQAISDCLNGKYLTAYGYKWKYVKTK